MITDSKNETKILYCYRDNGEYTKVTNCTGYIRCHYKKFATILCHNITESYELFTNSPLGLVDVYDLTILQSKITFDFLHRFKNLRVFESRDSSISAVYHNFCARKQDLVRIILRQSKIEIDHFMIYLVDKCKHKAPIFITIIDSRSPFNLNFIQNLPAKSVVNVTHSEHMLMQANLNQLVYLQLKSKVKFNILLKSCNCTFHYWLYELAMQFRKTVDVKCSSPVTGSVSIINECKVSQLKITKPKHWILIVIIALIAMSLIGCLVKRFWNRLCSHTTSYIYLY
ncbi:hypothetical protein GJ496_011483 [Pomphorhynchus laevis]|nr:hypothetical protein GJ496_011483 [Pomphorhynchus laevis]